MINLLPLPESLNPTLALFINGLVLVHILAFAIYVIMLMRSFTKGNTEKELTKFKKEQQGKFE